MKYVYTLGPSHFHIFTLSVYFSPQAVTNKEIDDAVDRIVAGLEGKPLVDGKAKSLVAYHEVGHAICGTLTLGHDPVQKVTLIPRGQVREDLAVGFTPFLDVTPR